MDAKVVKGWRNREPVPFCGLSVVFRQGKKTRQDFLLGNTGEVTLPERAEWLQTVAAKYIDSIFVLSWLCGTAGRNRLLEKFSWIVSCGWGA